MTGKKVLEVVSSYEEVLKRKGIAPLRLHPRVVAPSEKALLCHAAWMVREIKLLVSEGEDRIGKAFRWLGFVQAILLATGVFCIEDLKNHSRPD